MRTVTAQTTDRGAPHRSFVTWFPPTGFRLLKSAQKMDTIPNGSNRHKN